MEAASLGWATEIARAGFGYLLFIASLIVLWRKDQECQKCQKQVLDYAERVSAGLQAAAHAMAETADVDRGRTETDKVNAQVIQALIRAHDMSDARAGDRAVSINQSIEGIVGRIEAILTRAMGGRRGGE